MNQYWNWKLGGLILGLTFFFALFLIEPIGVSTQFSVTSGIAESVVDQGLIYEDTNHKTGYGSTNAYYDKGEGKLAKAIAKPMNYNYIFVLSMVLGGVLSALTIKKAAVKEAGEDERLRRTSPQVFRETISSKPWVRYVVVFLGGLVSLFGARLAGGCTSGHMMSGISQTALSGIVFAMVVFAVAIPTALLVYRKRN
ncbi:MAG: YeeE/YedE thiosulfate transporter family protein [Cellulosilyticaceae bacterium]